MGTDDQDDPPGSSQPKPDREIIEIAAAALKKGKVIRDKDGVFGLEYLRFHEHHRGVERGTVVTKTAVIRGFPHIRRIFTLEAGIRHNIGSDGRLYIEEKIDGFNVRIAHIDGKVFGFSRGGFLDAFVTEKAREMRLERFFKANPGFILCGEMIGNTPYTAPSEKFDVKLFIFDIDMGDGRLMLPKERYGLLDKFGLDYPPMLGCIDTSDFASMRKIALALNKARKEGMVMKSEDRSKVLKYVTPNSDIEDIAQSSSLFFDMPIGFFHQRVLRSAFFIKDFALDRDEYGKRIGEAFYRGLEKSIAAAGSGEAVGEEFEILIKEPAVWGDIRRHMSKEVKIEELWKREEKDGRTRIRFQKIFKRTTKLLSSYSKGKGIVD